jgi:hypothetical protein
MGLLLLAVGWMDSAYAQAEDGPPAASQALVSPPSSMPGEQPVDGTVIREIDDPHTGDRWLLVRDSIRPGAPGRMVLIAAGTSPLRRAAQVGTAPVAPLLAIRAQAVPVIHAGDRLIVEENTRRVEVRLEAVALGQAVSGAPLNVRLAIGGNVVRTVALGPGRATFAAGVGVRP